MLAESIYNASVVCLDKIFGLLTHLTPVQSGLLLYFILVPVALALRGPLGWLGRHPRVTGDYVDSITNPQDYDQQRQGRVYTPLTAK